MSLPAPVDLPAVPRPARRILAFALLVALAALVALSAGFHARIMSLVDVARDVIVAYPLAGAIVFVLLAAASAMLVLFSGAVLVPIGIEAWGETGCFVLLLTGWWLGGVATYAIGRAFGRPLLERLLPAPTVEQYARRIGDAGSFATALLVLVSLPSDVIGYVFGVLRYRFGRYLAALLLAELPYAFATVFMGAAFLERQLWPLLLAGGLALALYAWQRRRRRRAP